MEAADNAMFTVRDLESKARTEAAEMRKTLGGGRPQGMTAADEAKRANVRDLQRRLSEHLGTKVQIFVDRKVENGKLVIPFYGVDHFQGVLEKLGLKE
jgi:hypothetical protein